MYVTPETMPAEDHFTATKTFGKNCKKISISVTVPEHWLVFSYKRSKGYELDQNFDDIEFKNNQTTHSTIKLNYFARILW